SRRRKRRCSSSKAKSSARPRQKPARRDKGEPPRKARRLETHYSSTTGFFWSFGMIRSASAGRRDCFSVVVTLAVVIVLSTLASAETLLCQAQSARAADAERPSMTATARTVFMAFLLFR